MIILSTRAELLSAATLPLPLDLARPLAASCRHALDRGLGDLTCVVVALASDAEPDLTLEIGGSLLHNPLDGLRYGQPGFAPPVDRCQAHPGWTELTVCVGNSGFAYVVFVEERGDALGRMCRELAG